MMRAMGMLYQSRGTCEGRSSTACVRCEIGAEGLFDAATIVAGGSSVAPVPTSGPRDSGSVEAGSLISVGSIVPDVTGDAFADNSKLNVSTSEVTERLIPLRHFSGKSRSGRS